MVIKYLMRYLYGRRLKIEMLFKESFLETLRYKLQNNYDLNILREVEITEVKFCYL